MVVGGLFARLAPDDDPAGALVQNGDHGLIARRAGMEEALGLPAVQVEAVQEGAVSFGRSSGARQEDGRAVHADDGFARRVLRHHRVARVAVPVVRAPVPEQGRAGAGSGCVHDPGPGPPGGPVEFEYQGGGAVLAPQHRVAEAEGARAKTVLGTDELRARPVEGRLQGHDPVTVGDVLPGVAAIEGFHMGQGGEHTGAPRILAASGPAKAQVLGPPLVHRQRCKRAERSARAVEDLHLLREACVRHQVRVRADRADREEVLAAGRGLEGLVDRRGADSPGLSRDGVDKGRLRGEVVVEERLVVAVLEEILEGPGRSRLAFRFLDDRPGGDRGLGRGIAAVPDDEVAEKRLAAGHPRAGLAPRAVQFGVGQSAGGAADGIGQPEGDPAPAGPREGEALAVR